MKQCLAKLGSLTGRGAESEKQGAVVTLKVLKEITYAVNIDKP